MLSLSLSAFTTFHVVLSLIGIVAGLVMLAAMLRGGLPAGWTTLFLVTTIATSVTGFMFPFTGVLPSHILGVLSLLVLALASGWRLLRAWRPASSV